MTQETFNPKIKGTRIRKCEDLKRVSDLGKLVKEYGRLVKEYGRLNAKIIEHYHYDIKKARRLFDDYLIHESDYHE